MGTFDPLRDYLAARSNGLRELTLTFEDVEALVGRLPVAAREHRGWWANDSKAHAQSWRDAGWRVRAVNQHAERVVFARGAVGGRGVRLVGHAAVHESAARALLPAGVSGPEDPGGPPATAEPPPRTPGASAPLSLGPQISDDVVEEHLVAHLVGQGWQVHRVGEAASREHGVDLLATRDGRTVAVEVQGYPGAVEQDAPGVDEVASLIHTRQCFGEALLKGMLTRGDHPDFDIAIALPDAPTYRALHARIRESLSRLDVMVVFVTADGDVREA